MALIKYTRPDECIYTLSCTNPVTIIYWSIHRVESRQFHYKGNDLTESYNAPSLFCSVQPKEQATVPKTVAPKS